MQVLDLKPNTAIGDALGPSKLLYFSQIVITRIEPFLCLQDFIIHYSDARN